MDFQLINELSESRLFRSIDKYQKYSLKDIAELAYIYILSLELLRLSNDHKDFAQKYAKDTIRFNNFKSFRFATNDLYHFFHLLLGEGDRLKDTSHYTYIDFSKLRIYLRAVANDRYDEEWDRKYILRLENELNIKDSNLKAIRRMVINYMGQGDDSMKKSALTKLLLIVRKRIPKGEIRAPLEKLSRDKLDEYKMIKIDLSGNISRPNEIPIYKNPSHQEFSALVQKHGALRALLDKRNNIYVWNANDAIHGQVEVKLFDEITFMTIKLSFHNKLPRTWDGAKVDPNNPDSELNVIWKEINNIWIEGYNQGNVFRMPDSKWLKRALGVSKLDEYKIIKADNFKIFKNPLRSEFLTLLNKSEFGAMRGLLAETGDVYIWEAYYAEHGEAIDEIGFPEPPFKIQALFFSKDEDPNDDFLELINGIWFASYGDLEDETIPQSKFLNKILGLNKLDEYKMIQTDLTKVYRNPLRSEFLTLIDKHNELRGLIDTSDNLYVWKSYDAEHFSMQTKLGIEANCALMFSIDSDTSEPVWDAMGLYKVDGFYYGSSDLEISDHNKHVQKVLGPNKLDEYKMHQIEVGHEKLDLKVYQNPSNQELNSLLDKYRVLRGVTDTKGYLYVWTAYSGNHYEVEKVLAIDGDADLFLTHEGNIDLDKSEHAPMRTINGITVHIEAESQDMAKFLKRALGVRLNEYKMIKVPSSSALPGSDPIIRVFVNPRRQEFLELLNRHKEIRGLVDQDENLYIWDAAKEIHFKMGMELAVLIGDGSRTGAMFYDTVIFAKEDTGRYHEWDFEEINGIYFASRTKKRDSGLHGQWDPQKDATIHSPHVKNVLYGRQKEVKKIDEYKLFKMDAKHGTYMSHQLTYNIYKNPTGLQVEEMLLKWYELRGCISDTDDIYVWKALDQTHYQAQNDMEEANIDHRFRKDFVFSTGNEIDDEDWLKLEKIGNYFYGQGRGYVEKNRVAVGKTQNKFLSRIFNYFKRDEHG